MAATSTGASEEQGGFVDPVAYGYQKEETSNNAFWYGGGMALHDVILITFNRRDDAFGYLATPELNAEGKEATGHESSGNYGVLDFLEVLKWVQKNAAAFGGDPDRVTIAGQSFGSGQVYHALNSELFTGLFHGAISESGIRYPQDPLVAGLATSYVEMPLALEFGINYTLAHNVSTIEELRKLPVSSLLDGSDDRQTDATFWWVTALSTDLPLIFKPVLDHYVIPKRYIYSLFQGPANDVPVITGNAKDESGAALSTDYTDAEYKEYCTLKYANMSSRYFDLYPIHTNQSLTDRAWNAAAQDESLVGSWAFATKWYGAAISDFYTYFWTHAPPGQEQGAFHQSEIMYALNALYANDDVYPFTDADYEIARKMSGYWANFAKTLNPNEGGSYTGTESFPEWAPNSPNGTQEVMQLGDESGNQPVAGPENVEFVMAFTTNSMLTRMWISLWSIPELLLANVVWLPVSVWTSNISD